METRNTGITLEVTPRVLDDERSQAILVKIDVQRTSTVAFDYHALGRTKEGHFACIHQPRFGVSNTRATLLLRSGVPMLIGVHTLPSPDDPLELVIARAVAVKTSSGLLPIRPPRTNGSR